MAFVSVTRLRIRSPRYLPQFGYYTWVSARQLKLAAGFLEGQLAYGGQRSFWTLTVWRDQQAMRAYRNTGAHMRAMPKLLEWCDEASVVNWEQEASELPTNEEAQKRMVAEGRLSKVRHPSQAHAAGQIQKGPPPQSGPRIRPVN